MRPGLVLGEAIGLGKVRYAFGPQVTGLGSVVVPETRLGGAASCHGLALRNFSVSREAFVLLETNYSLQKILLIFFQFTMVQ